MGFKPDEVDYCPHCAVKVKLLLAAVSWGHGYRATSGWVTISPGDGPAAPVSVSCCTCPSCGQVVVSLHEDECGRGPSRLIWPPIANRGEVSEHVPEELLGDYEQATLVLPFSPKASAALSRRCLQHLLVLAAGVNPKWRLVDQISEAVAALPSYVASQVDCVRRFGNFGAHPIECAATGQIVEVDEGEADYLLTILELLFDHYYAKPAQAQAMADQLAAKLKPLGGGQA